MLSQALAVVLQRQAARSKLLSALPETRLPVGDVVRVHDRLQGLGRQGSAMLSAIGGPQGICCLLAELLQAVPQPSACKVCSATAHVASQVKLVPQGRSLIVCWTDGACR